MSTTSTPTPARCCCAARAASNDSCRSGGPRSRRSTPTWCEDGPSCAARTHRGDVPQRTRRTIVTAERVAGVADRRRASRRHHRGVPAHAAALVRDPPARRRRRRSRGAGVTRACLGDDHADLHAGHRGCAARGLGRCASPRAVIEAPRKCVSVPATRHPGGSVHGAEKR